MKEKAKSSGKSKSASAKKQSEKKKTTKDGTTKGNLIKELRSAIKEIDEEGLMFLLKQAHVLVYNQKVVKLNEESQKVSSKSASKSSANQSPFSDKITMEINEADDGSSFVFAINRARKFFTLEEMRKIVKVCHNSSGEKDASKRLYAWFKNNRGDVLNDVEIGSSGDPSLATMYNYIIKRYTVKGS